MNIMEEISRSSNSAQAKPVLTNSKPIKNQNSYSDSSDDLHQQEGGDQDLQDFNQNEGGSATAEYKHVN